MKLPDWISGGSMTDIALPSLTALYAISVRQARDLPIRGPFNP